MGAGRIFINYRRSDDPGFTHALYQRLEGEFGHDRLFMDVEGYIKPGDDFAEVLGEQVAQCDILLVVIGPRWEEMLAARAGDPNDFVTHEIKAALDQGKRIIPVLVGDASFPCAELLPDEIRPLARKNAVDLLPKRFGSDCRWLISHLNEVLRQINAEQTAEAERAVSTMLRQKHQADEDRHRGSERTVHRSRKVFGIDLGTANSCVAIMEGCIPKVIENSEGMRTTPSIVAFTGGGERLIGLPAKRQSATNPANTISSIQRLMGLRYDDPEVEETKKSVSYKIIRAEDGGACVETRAGRYSPSQISAFILQKMKDTVEAYLGEKVARAVITVPGYFNEAQRKATKDAGEIAGLEDICIIDEPAAAALAYGFTKDNQTIAVYDLDIHQFDVSILENLDGRIEVKSTHSDLSVGGEDFIFRLADYFAAEFEKESRVDLREDKLAMQRLKEAAEKGVLELCSVSQTEIKLHFITADQTGPKHLAMKITRAKLESLVDDLLRRTIAPCHAALKEANLSANEIDEVILVGSATLMPKIVQTVVDIFGKDPHKNIAPDEVVAMGAATQGGVLQGITTQELGCSARIIK